MMYSSAHTQGVTHLRGRLMREGAITAALTLLCSVYVDLIQKYRLERLKTKPEQRQQKMFNCLSKILHILKLRKS